MGTNYPCPAAVVDFVSSLTGSEQVCVYLFVTRTGARSPVMDGSVAASASPPRPFGRIADIGLALHKGVQWLRRDGAGATGPVSPDGWPPPAAPDSPFGSDYRTDPDWQQLRERGHKVARGGGLSMAAWA